MRRSEIKYTKTEEKLMTAMAEMDIIDVHEHLSPEKQRTDVAQDVFTLFSHYTRCDLTSAGMDEPERGRGPYVHGICPSLPSGGHVAEEFALIVDIARAALRSEFASEIHRAHLMSGPKGIYLSNRFQRESLEGGRLPWMPR